MFLYSASNIFNSFHPRRAFSNNSVSHIPFSRVDFGGKQCETRLSCSFRKERTKTLSETALFLRMTKNFLQKTISKNKREEWKRAGLDNGRIPCLCLSLIQAFPASEHPLAKTEPYTNLRTAKMKLSSSFGDRYRRLSPGMVCF